MTQAPQGETTTLIAEFFDSPGGIGVNVTGLTITITRISDGVVMIGPTSTGVNHVGTGTYGYGWAVAIDAETVDYLVEWNGVYNASAIVASEIVTVVDITPGVVPTGPCGPWPVNWSVCNLTGVNPAVTGAAVAAATEVLWSLTGRRFGECQLTIRPCRRECSGMDSGFTAGGWAGGWWEYGTFPRPLFFNGVWYNITCGGCTGTCSCSMISEAILPGPVSSIVQVKVDGVTLDSSAYRVDDYYKLIRTDGQMWPICNNLNLNDTEVGTWSVTVQFGEAVPTLGEIAMGELACQFARLLSGNEDCKLPKPIQQLVRQGVTLNFLDPNEVFSSGKIGLYMSDLFISTMNPSGLSARPAVYDIDGEDYRITGVVS